MLKRIIFKMLERRFFWRFVGFNELSELYTSMMLRSIGLSLVGIFVPIYLYKLGYDLVIVFLFLAGIFGIRFIGNPIAGHLVAWIGPKHVMLISYIAQIVSLAMLLTLPAIGWPLWLISSVWGLSLSLFFIAYHVDFSKVMHTDHGGKELGLMTALERLGGALGPLIGGAVAYLFGPQYTIVMALVFFALAVIPLFITAEPVRTHQKLDFRDLPYRALTRDFFSFSMLGVENTISLGLWPLFLAVTVFAANPYIGVGFVTSLGVIAAILAARFIGQLIDRDGGELLLRWSASVGGILQLLRPFIGSFGGVVLMNLAYDGVATGFRLAVIKGAYTRADELPGHRIAYIVCIETAGDIGRTLVWLSMAGLSLVLPSTQAMTIGFVVGALASGLIMTQRFPGLWNRRVSLRLAPS